MKYTNRIGKIYYLRKGVTKTGKPRYFFSTQETGKGDAVDVIPDGHEAYEHPENAQVFLRKTGPQIITDIEKQLVKKHVDSLQRSTRFIIDCKDKYITIYESSLDTEILGNIFGAEMSRFAKVADRRYSGVLRFGLVDKKRRTFAAQRFCFRGAIDGWIYLGGPDELNKLVGKSVNLLGTDKFFELPF
jgi:hypothetical protein